MNVDDVEIVDSIDSTQDEFKRRIAQNAGAVGCLVALDQTSGRGRFGREWSSVPGQSLAMSLALPFNDKPWLTGFMVALAAASAFHTRIQWPNDLTIKRRKVGGVLTEVINSPNGEKKLVVGVGFNLNQTVFPPPLDQTATSLLLERGTTHEPEAAAKLILERLSRMNVPQTWQDVAPIWGLFDDTPGKPYKLPSGVLATALGLGPDGELIASVDGETRSILAAEALFGPEN